MSSNELVLYDIPTREPYKCWTPNPWKTRLALNFKGISYKTEWVDYPDIEGKFKAFGLAPNKPGTAPCAYTIPAITLPSGEHIMNSEPISHELEKLQPSPSLHLDSPTSQKAANLTGQLMGHIFPLLAPKIPSAFLSARNAEYYIPAREKNLGMTFEELQKSDISIKAWENAKPVLEEVEKLLAQQEGPFSMGQTPCYGDLVLVSFMLFLKGIDEKLLTRFWKESEGTEKLFNACEQWTERDDH